MKKLELPKLPYSYDALEPVISKRIMELHHTKHHKSYVDGVNKALELIESSVKESNEINYKHVLRDLSFNYNGHILHSIFWKNMREPQEDNEPEGKIKEVIELTFGSFQKFKELFSKIAASVEGSGWGIVAKDMNGRLHLLQVEKHNLLHVVNFKPLLVIDVWEHAYYLQYENRRKEYIDNWWKVVNWGDVERRYKE